ncbi:MAG: D-alanyl-D-alanine carboxypeptidase family protein [Azospirillaceae bacterium]
MSVAVRSARSPLAFRFTALALVLLASLAAWPGPAAALDTAAREAILIDMTSDTVLMEKDADQPMPTASMSKIMTMYMVFEALDEGRLSLDDRLPVSEYAWQKGGSKMFVEVGDRVRVEDLIRGVIVQSGNDASIVLAEALAGSEEAFGQRMTDRARELGMENSNFMNATGWPHPDHYSTARDLALLAERLINEFPEYYHYYAELEFTYNDITQGNRNPLLYRDIGADGLKTGHTEEAGYGLTASAERDGRRLILVVTGLGSAQERADEAARLMEWGFREFEAVSLFDAGEPVVAVDTWMGSPDSVDLVPREDLSVTVRRVVRDELSVSVRVEEPVPAPIAAGDRLGTLIIRAPEQPVREVPLVAAEDVARKGFFGRVTAGAVHLVTGLVE